MAASVVIYPFAAQITRADATSRPQEVLTAFLSKRQIAHLDLLPGIAGSVADPASIFIDADHFNPSGSTLVATAIAQFLDRSPALRDGS